MDQGSVGFGRGNGPFARATTRMNAKPRPLDATNEARCPEGQSRPSLQGRDARLPLVYSCSGASSAAQMANHLAVRLDRLRAADMSCIAGLGGDVGPLVRTAKSGRPILAIDGCPLRCALRTLQRHGVQADWHCDLAERGIAKRPHEDFSPKEAKVVLAHLLSDLAACSSEAGGGEGRIHGEGPAERAGGAESGVGGGSAG